MLTDIEQRAQQLQIACHQPVSSILAGEYRSVFRGVGLEFDQIREYASGDDVRFIDWKVTARTGHAYIRQYIEERQLTVWLLVDTSASFLVGEDWTGKAGVAAEVCALLGFSAAANQDRVGLALFTNQLERVERPRGGTGHVVRLLEDLLSFPPLSKPTDIGAVLDEFHAYSSKHEIVFLISDFQSPAFDLALRRARLRQSVYAICIEHTHERKLPRVGLLRLRDAETDECCVIDTENEVVRCAFAAAVEKRGRARSDFFSAANVDLLDLTSEDDCAHKLSKFLEVLRYKGDARYGVA